MFTWGFLDTHFGFRGRQGRMARLIWDLYGSQQDKSKMIGFGVGENTSFTV